jgi:hypothetical protein
VFQVHAVDERGNEIDKRAIRRVKLLDYFAALPPCAIAITVTVYLIPKTIPYPGDVTPAILIPLNAACESDRRSDPSSREWRG